eukprot:Seg1734.7 transcript_id=Seg1734.7/GoldUCD/mRNA.D3Y31 product="hypothetical protein" protein_id=Seg1734.7/GoldUCD/D3Y31
MEKQENQQGVRLLSCEECKARGKNSKMYLSMVSLSMGIWMCRDKKCYFPLNSPKLKVYMENVDESVGIGKRKAKSNKETSKKVVSEKSYCKEADDSKVKRKRELSTSTYSSVTTSSETKRELQSSKEKEGSKSEGTRSIDSDFGEHRKTESNKVATDTNVNKSHAKTEWSKVKTDTNSNTLQTCLIKKEDNDRILERLTIVSGTSSDSSISDGVTLTRTQHANQQPSYLKKWLTKIEYETHKNIVIDEDTIENQTEKLNMLQRYTPYVRRKKRISEDSRISMELTPTNSHEPSFLILESKQDITDDKADMGGKRLDHIGKNIVYENDSAYSSPLSDENGNKTNENLATYLGMQEKETNSFNSSLDMIDSLFEGCSPVEGTYAKELLEKSSIFIEDDFNFEEIDISQL